MTEQQFTDEYAATEADAAEQSLPVDGAPDEDEAPGARATAQTPREADPADAAEQAVPVPVDEDEYR